MTTSYDPRVDWTREDNDALCALSFRVDALCEAVTVADGGFSIDPVTGENVTGGYAVSVHPECGSIHGIVTPGTIMEFMLTNEDQLRRPGSIMGGWRDPADGRIYLDVSTLVADRDEAIALGAAHDQMAVFDFAAGESVRTY